MIERFEFELVFALPDQGRDPFELSDAVFKAGYEDAVVGTGVAGLLGVALEAEGSGAEATILEAARKLLKFLPDGTQLREVRPDLVSLADVAEKLHVRRQSLQQREMPLPSSGGLYRIDELAAALEKVRVPEDGKRRPRLDIEAASSWLRAGYGARQINAKLTIRELDPRSLDTVAHDDEKVRMLG